MNAATLDDLRPRPRDRLSRGMALALVAHALLVIALSLGVSWRSSEPAGVEAELWAAVPQAAAPRAVEPEPPKPRPAPAPAPEPPKPAPRAETLPPPSRDAEIAREKREEKDRLERQRLEDERKEAAAKREQDRKEQERKQAEQRRQEQAKAEAEKREAEQEKKAAAERQARIEAQRADHLRRIQGQAGATGSAESTGTAQQSAGPSASYAGRIKARIKPNITFYEDIPSNPTAVVEVRAAPDGSILGRRLTKSSGVPAWDDAVLRAIDKTEVLPRDTDGRVPSPMEIAFRPRDL